MKEVWKDIKEFEGYYQVSNLGRVRSVDRVITYSNGRKHFEKSKIMKPYINRYGYMIVNFHINAKSYTFRVNRLVAIAFIPNPENYPVVNHIDGVKTNNNVNNLEWCTYTENNLHAFRTGLAKISDEHREKMIQIASRGIKKRKVKCLETGKIYESVRKAAKDIGCSNMTICTMLKGRQKSVKGLHFIYID